jgi:hypothetical protein
MILGGAVVKFPQIYNLVQAGDAVGVSLVTQYLELFLYGTPVAYNMSEGAVGALTSRTTIPRAALHPVHLLQSISGVSLSVRGAHLWVVGQVAACDAFSVVPLLR